MKSNLLFLVISFLLYAFLYSCNTRKGTGNSYQGKDKMYLTTKMGPPDEILTDSTGEERLIYQKDRKIYNPKYTSVVVYTTYYLTPEGKVYKQKHKCLRIRPIQANLSMR